jgi:hypothetical protein
MNSSEIELDPLAPRIEEALLLSGDSQSRFGYVHFGDPAFIKKMREGRRFTRKMVAKIEDVLAALSI